MNSHAKAASVSSAFPMGKSGTNWELGFKHCSFHHLMQVLQDSTFCAFSMLPAFPQCYFPLYLSASGKAVDLWNIPSISSLFESDTVLTVTAHLDPLGVDDPEHRRSGQEDLRPVLMGPEEAKQAGPLGEAGEQRPIVSRQPAIKRAVADAFEGMEQPQGDHLTGPEVGLGVFGDRAQLLIDLVEQRGDKIQGGHTALLACGKDVTQTSVEESSDDRKPKNLYH